MKNMRWILLLLALCFCFVIQISADDGNFGEIDVFETTGEQTAEPESTEPEQPTTEPESTEPEQTTTEPESTEPE